MRFSLAPPSVGDNPPNRVIGSQVADLAIAAYEKEAAELLTPLVCPEDIDASGNVGTSDLLLLLSKYGEDCEE